MLRRIPFVPNAALRWRCPVCKGRCGGDRNGGLPPHGARRVRQDPVETGRCAVGRPACRWSKLSGRTPRHRFARRHRGGVGQDSRRRLPGVTMSGSNGADSPAPPGSGPAIGRMPGACLSPRTVDVDPRRSLTAPVAGHPPAPGAPRDPAAGHPYIAATLPAPVAVRPYIAVRPWWRRAAVVPGGWRREARAVPIRRPAGYAVRAWRPVRGRRGLGRGGTQPAGADEGGGQSDGAQQRASIHGVSCSVFGAALR